MSTAHPVATPDSPMLSDSQLATLAELGEERTADVGDVLYRVGDRRYPFIAILEGEVAILDAAGNEIVRHGPSSFLGELNLLSGQTVFVTAVVTQPLRYIAVDRDVLRELLFDDGPLSDLVLSTFIARREALQRSRASACEIVGPHSSAATMRMLDFARSNRLPFTWHDPSDDARRVAGSTTSCRSCACRAARSCGRPRRASSRVRSGSAASSRRAKRSTCSSSAPVPRVSARPCTAPPRGSTRWSSRAPRSAARRAPRAGSRTTSASPPASAAPSSTEPRGHPGAQVRRAAGDALPGGRARAGKRAPRRAARGGARDRRARRRCSPPAREYRRLPVDGLARLRGPQRLLRRRAAEAQLCGASRVGVVGGGNSAGQAAVWLARGGALVTLLHRRADLRETMSDYLVRDLERYGVAVRDRSEIAALHGTDGQLEAVTLTSGERLPFSFLFLFLGARPCTEWLGDTVARDEDGFILTGADARRRPPARDERPGRLRGRRRPLGLDQALRHRGRRGRDGRAVRPRASPLVGDVRTPVI